MLLNILQCTGQPSTTRIIRYKMSIILRLRNPVFEVIGFRESWWGTGKWTISLGRIHSTLAMKRVNLVVIKSNSEHSCYEKDIRPPFSFRNFINNAHTSLLMVKHPVYTPPLPNKPSRRKEIQSKFMTCPTPSYFTLPSTPNMRDCKCSYA